MWPYSVNGGKYRLSHFATRDEAYLRSLNGAELRAVTQLSTVVKSCYYVRNPLTTGEEKLRTREIRVQFSPGKVPIRKQVEHLTEAVSDIPHEMTSCLAAPQDYTVVFKFNHYESAHCSLNFIASFRKPTFACSSRLVHHRAQAHFGHILVCTSLKSNWEYPIVRRVLFNLITLSGLKSNWPHRAQPHYAVAIQSPAPVNSGNFLSD